MSKFNEQEVFNRVRNHLLAQNRKSMNNGSCAYRGANGLKCALGIFIPDDDYSDIFESFAVTKTIVKDSMEFDSLEHKDILFMGDLQEIHDEIEVQDWKDYLDDFASDHHLTP